MATVSLAENSNAGLTSDVSLAEISTRVQQHFQDHILAFRDELSDTQVQSFGAQLESIDFEQLDQLIQGEVASCDVSDLASRVSPPPARRLSQTRQVDCGIAKAARQVGEAALKCGLFGVVIVAGGQGSRLGFPHPKGTYPIGPVSEASLFQILIHKIHAVAARYETRIPLYLMTSPATHQDTVDYLDQHDRFGLSESDLIVFCQGTMPAIETETGRLLLAEKDSLFMSPDGHGGMLAALKNAGAIQDMKERGIEHLFYCQVDNPLVELLSPDFVGYHILAASDVTTQAVARKDAAEKVGNIVAIDGRLHIIEYSDLPQELAERQNDDGSLELWAGSIAVHAFSVGFLEEAAESGRLPFHVAHKKVPHINAEGERVTPTENNGIKFERFIFDLLPMARRSLVVEVNEEEAFAPLKNAAGKDSADYVRDRMSSLFHMWLTAAGIEVPSTMIVEIDPEFADSAEVLRQKNVQPPSASTEIWHVSGE